MNINGRSYGSCRIEPFDQLLCHAGLGSGRSPDRTTNHLAEPYERRFLAFHNKCPPAELGEAEISQFLSALAVEHQVSAATQNQALNALVFLYRHVLQLDVGQIGNIVRAKQAQRLPVVLRKHEVKALLDALDGVHWLMGHLLYGAGLRLMECLGCE